MSATDAEDLLGARSTSKDEPGAGAAGVERATDSGPSLLVQVRLIDGNFRAVAGGELVWLDTARPGARARVAADRAGAAFLAISTGELPREGLLAFAVSASGFSRELVNIDVAEVRGETSLNLGEIVLARGGSASGRIVDEQHRPIAGRIVALTSGPAPAAWHDPWAESDRDGRCAFPGLSAGEFSLVVMPSVEGEPLELLAALEVSIVEGQETKLGEIVLRVGQERR